MKKVVYWWQSKVNEQLFKQQLDAVIAAAVFDTRPLVIISGSQAKIGPGVAKALSALTMLDLAPIYTEDCDDWYAQLVEADHVVRF